MTNLLKMKTGEDDDRSKDDVQSSQDDDLDADGGSSGGHGLQGVLDLDQLPAERNTITIRSRMRETPS